MPVSCGDAYQRNVLFCILEYLLGGTRDLILCVDTVLPNSDYSNSYASYVLYSFILQWKWLSSSPLRPVLSAKTRQESTIASGIWKIVYVLCERIPSVWHLPRFATSCSTDDEAPYVLVGVLSAQLNTSSAIGLHPILINAIFIPFLVSMMNINPDLQELCRYHTKRRT